MIKLPCASRLAVHEQQQGYLDTPLQLLRVAVAVNFRVVT
jgi:hypothetical protein